MSGGIRDLRRSTLIRTALAVVVLLVLVLGFVYWYGHSQLPASVTRTPNNTPVTAAQTQASINRGTKYLKLHLAQVAPYQRLMQDFLQRKFSLDSTFSVQVTPIEDTQWGSDSQTAYAALERIAYPDHLVDSLSPLDTTTDSMITYAANCDRIPLPDGYENTLRQNLKEGSYAMTHVVFAFDFIQDNGCAVPASWTKIRQQALQGTLRFALDPAVDQDIRYESIAFVLHNGMRSSVKPAAIRQIIKEQRRDGGWGGAKTDTGMQDHQTVLALWALLEYAHPDAPKVRLIQRPN